MPPGHKNTKVRQSKPHQKCVLRETSWLCDFVAEKVPVYLSFVTIKRPIQWLKFEKDLQTQNNKPLPEKSGQAVANEGEILWVFRPGSITIIFAEKPNRLLRKWLFKLPPEIAGLNDRKDNLLFLPNHFVPVHTLQAIRWKDRRKHYSLWIFALQGSAIHILVS